MERCFDFRASDRLLVARQNGRPPTDSDWKALCQEVNKLQPRLREIRALVFTDGGAPTPEQRKSIAHLIAGSDLMTAVITDRPLIRFIVSTIGLFNKKIQTFGTKDVEKSFEWLQLTRIERRTVTLLLRDLETTVCDLRESSKLSTS